MPPETVGHFGMSGTYLWVVPGGGASTSAAMVLLTGREFGDWAKPLWQETNTRIYHSL